MNKNIVEQALELKQGEDIIVPIDADYCDAFNLTISEEENLRLIQRSAVEDESGTYTWQDCFKAMFEADQKAMKRDKILLKAFSQVLGDVASVEYLKSNGVAMQLDADNQVVRIFRV